MLEYKHINKEVFKEEFYMEKERITIIGEEMTAHNYERINGCTLKEYTKDNYSIGLTLLTPNKY